MLHDLLTNEDGQALVEYGLILGLVSVALVTSLTGIKAGLLNVFNDVVGKLGKAITAKT
jgi:pilus assembly protein Flp/PilA